VIAPLKLKCPACGAPVDAPVEECPECVMSWPKLDRRFGVAPKNSGRLTDRSGSLSHAEQHRLKKQLRLFRRKFPQSLFYVMLLEMPAGCAMGEYLFWLANRWRIGTAAAVEKNNFDLLLLINVAGNAGLTIGYGLENYLREDDLQMALKAGRPAWSARRWADGIERCLQQLTERMREIVRAQK
jgi:uncharacterized membrane protein YgcG